MPRKEKMGSVGFSLCAQCSLLALRGGFESEWVAAVDELIKMGHVKSVAHHLANMVASGLPQLAALGTRALAQTLPSARVTNTSFSLEHLLSWNSSKSAAGSLLQPAPKGCRTASLKRTYTYIWQSALPRLRTPLNMS